MLVTSRLSARIAAGAARVLRRFLGDERGAELIQFVFALPIIMGLVWTGYEAWQITTLRAAVRSTAAQTARYFAAFGAPTELQGPPPSAELICDGVRQLVTSSLSQYKGNLGDALTWEIRWYRILDPNDSRWDGNAALICVQSMAGAGDDCCGDLVSSILCNDHFGIEIEVSVPWQVVLFGMRGSSVSTSALTITERVTGSSPCMPYCSIEVGGRTIASGDEGCWAEVCWGFENRCSYEPDRCEVWVDGDLVSTVYNPRYNNCEQIDIPVGGASVEVVCYGGRREARDGVPIACGD